MCLLVHVHTSMHCYDKDSGLHQLSACDLIFAILAHCLSLALDLMHVTSTRTRAGYSRVLVLILDRLVFVSHTCTVAANIKFPYLNRTACVAYFMALHNVAEICCVT